jgi:hypothetical protein
MDRIFILTLYFKNSFHTRAPNRVCALTGDLIIVVVRADGLDVIGIRVRILDGVVITVPTKAENTGKI